MAKGKKAVPGEGSRFKNLSNKLKKQGVKNPDALAAKIGRDKYGPSDMAKAAAAGKKGEVHRMKKGGK